jgi:hypothetical protein
MFRVTDMKMFPIIQYVGVSPFRNKCKGIVRNDKRCVTINFIPTQLFSFSSKQPAVKIIAIPKKQYLDLTEVRTCIHFLPWNDDLNIIQHLSINIIYKSKKGEWIVGYFSVLAIISDTKLYFAHWFNRNNKKEISSLNYSYINLIAFVNQ